MRSRNRHRPNAQLVVSVLVFFAIVVGACGGDASAEPCLTGQQSACSCDNGLPGAKLCTSPTEGYGPCVCSALNSGQAATGTQGAAGTLASMTATGTGTAGANTASAGIGAGTSGNTAGSSATAGGGATTSDAGAAGTGGTGGSTEGVYKRCDASADTCPAETMCVHPGEGVDQQTGPTLCTPACTPPSFANPTPPNDCPAAASGSASAQCSLIESICFLDCSAGTCPDGMTCETLMLGPQAVMVCNYQ